MDPTQPTLKSQFVAVASNLALREVEAQSLSYGDGEWYEVKAAGFEMDKLGSSRRGVGTLVGWYFRGKPKERQQFWGVP